MSVMDALSVAAQCWNVAIMVYQQYSTQKEVQQSVGQYVSLVKMYQNSLQRLQKYIEEQQSNTLRTKDPQWEQDMQTFQSWAEEDKKDAAYLEHELKKIQNTSWWKNMINQAHVQFAEHQDKIYKKLEIIKFFMTMDMWQDGNKERKNIANQITDEEGRYFWYEYINSYSGEVTLEKLTEALQNFFEATQGFRLISQELTKVLKVTADTVISNDQITLYEYNQFMCRFGPLANILKKATAVCTIDGTPQPWFRAIADRRKLELEFQTKLAAHEKEHPEGPGFNTWVLRFSSEKSEHFVWSYMHNKKIFHVLIRNSVKGYHLKDLPKNQQGQEPKYYDTVIDLIAAESKHMHFQVDRSHLDEWQAFFDDNSGESHAYNGVDYDDDDNDNTEDVTSPTNVAVTVETLPKDPAAADKVSAIAAALIQEHESTSSPSSPSSPSTTTASAPTTSQTVIETKPTEKHEQNMTIVIDRVDSPKQTSSTPATQPATTQSTPTPTPAPATTTSTSAPVVSNDTPAPAPSPSSTTSQQSDVDPHVAQSAAASADAIEKAKDLTVDAPTRVVKPKLAEPEVENETPLPEPKPVKGCCTIM